MVAAAGAGDHLATGDPSPFFLLHSLSVLLEYYYYSTVLAGNCQICGACLRVKRPETATAAAAAAVSSTIRSHQHELSFSLGGESAPRKAGSH